MEAATMKVLVVEHGQRPLQAMVALLQAEGLTPLAAPSAAAALEWLQQHTVQLALLDAQMPGVDGFALAERLREDPRTQSVPIVIVSAAAQDAQRRFRGDEAAAVDFLHKPVDPRLLRARLAAHAALHRMAAQQVELEQQMRLNALMIGALSHDLRSPLAALVLNAELVSRRSELPGVQQAGARLKAAATMLGRQLDHLLSLATPPVPGLQPRREAGDLAALVQARLAADRPAAPVGAAPSFHASGDGRAMFDPALLARAVDLLLQQAVEAGGGRPVKVEVDGQGRRSVALRLTLEQALSDEAQARLLGSLQPAAAPSASRIGPALVVAERIARAHGGSLIGRSRERDGTWFELVLPRDLAAADGGGGLTA